MTDFIFLDSKITVNSDFRHEIKGRLLLGRKPMTNPDRVLKSRNITFPTKIYIDLVFPVVMHEELDHKEGWKSNWCFWIVVIEKTLESPLDSKEIKSVNPKENQPWILIESTDAEAEKLQSFGHLMWRASSLEKTLVLGKIEGRRRRGRQRMRWPDNITDARDMNLGKLGDGGGQGGLLCCSPWGHTTWWLNNS